MKKALTFQPSLINLISCQKSRTKNTFPFTFPIKYLKRDIKNVKSEYSTIQLIMKTFFDFTLWYLVLSLLLGERFFLLNVLLKHGLLKLWHPHPLSVISTPSSIQLIVLDYFAALLTINYFFLLKKWRKKKHC